MFSSRRQGQAKEAEVKTLIGEGCEFEGNVKLTEGTTARLDGAVNGNIWGRASLIVGKSGRVRGNVELEHVVVYGSIEGNIRAEKVELHGGSVRGDIVTRNLLVEMGSFFNGRCIMEEEGVDRGGQSPQGT